MKKLLCAMLFIIFLPMIAQASFHGIMKADEFITVIIKVPDSAGIRTLPDSVHIFGYRNDAAGAVYTVRSTTYPFATEGIDTTKDHGDTSYVFRDQIQDFDGSPTNAHYTVTLNITMWCDDGIPYENEAVVQVLNDSLQNYFDSLLNIRTVVLDIEDSTQATLDTLQRFTERQTDSLQAVLDSIQLQDEIHVIQRDSIFAILDSLQRFTEQQTDSLQAVLDSLQRFTERQTDSVQAILDSIQNIATLSDLADSTFGRWVATRGIVGGTPNVAGFSSVALTETQVNYWEHRWVYFVDGALAEQSFRCDAFTPSTDSITLFPVAPEVMAVGDSFYVLTLFSETPAGGSGDWTGTEKENIRDALGVDGTKTTASNGQLQTLSDSALAALEDDAVLKKKDSVEYKDTKSMQTDVMTADALHGDFAQEIADTNWDEPLTAATHNEPTSSGRRLRDISALSVITEGTAQSGTATSITLAAVTSFPDSVLAGNIISINSGTGAGQTRHIETWTSSTDVATLHEGNDWDVIPDATSKYTVSPSAPVDVAHINDSALSEMWNFPLTTITNAAGIGLTLRDTLSAILAGQFDNLSDSVMIDVSVALNSFITALIDSTWKSLVSGRSGVTGSFQDSSLGWGATAAGGDASPSGWDATDSSIAAYVALSNWIVTRGIVAGAPDVSGFSSVALTQTQANYWEHSWVYFVDGALTRQAFRVDAFTPSTDSITLSPVAPEVMAVGDSFYVLSFFSETPAGGSGDWSSTEKENIRDALGVDGTKTTASAGQLQTLSDSALAALEDDAVLKKKDSVQYMTTKSMNANVITSASINAAALNGKGDWNIGKSGYSLTTALDSLTLSQMLHRIVHGTPKGSGSDSSTLAERDVTVATFLANAITAGAINAGALDGKGDWNIGKTGYTLVSALDSLTLSQMLHRIMWGTPKGSGADSSTLAERDASVASILANVITAVSINAAALNGKGDWNIGKSGYALVLAEWLNVWKLIDTAASVDTSDIGDWLINNLVGAAGSLDSQVVSNIIHRVGWGTPRGSGSDSSTLAERDITNPNELGGGIVGANITWDLVFLDTSGADTRITSGRVEIQDNTSGVVLLDGGPDAQGEKTFTVTTGTFAVVYRGVGFTVDSSHRTVTANQTDTIKGFDIVTGSPGSADLSRVSGNIKTIGDIGIDSVLITFSTIGGNVVDTTGVSVIISPLSDTTMSIADGSFFKDLRRTITFADTTKGFYKVVARTNAGRGKKIFTIKKLRIPDSGNLDLGDIVAVE